MCLWCMAACLQKPTEQPLPRFPTEPKWTSLGVSPSLQRASAQSCTPRTPLRLPCTSTTGGNPASVTTGNAGNMISEKRTTSAASSYTCESGGDVRGHERCKKIVCTAWWQGGKFARSQFTCSVLHCSFEPGPGVGTLRQRSTRGCQLSGGLEGAVTSHPLMSMKTT